MYNVSADYITAMRAASRVDEVYGTVYFTDETTLDITPSIMPTNSISISKQCTDGEELMFGGVFLSTLKLSLNTTRPRYDFYGATIVLNYKVRTGFDANNDPIWEVVPLGKFVVADADRPHDTVNLTAYDSMRLLDIDLGDKVLQGNAWTVLSTISTDTGYQLSFTQESLANFVNYDALMQLDGTRGIQTYRDAVKCVCQLLGCFAQDDRTGKLELRKFSGTTTATLTKAHWYSMTPADYMCNYVALSVTSLAGTFTAQEEDEFGNIMVIDDAPALDYGLEVTLQGYTDALFNYLKDIDYTPCDIDMPSDPAFDCGDRLALVINANTTIYSLITSYEWKWHSGMSIESNGVNPYLTGVSTSDVSRIVSQEISDNKVQFFNFTNPFAHSIGDNETKVIGSVKFAATAKTNAMFIATILVEVTVPDIEVDTEEEVEVPVIAYDKDGNEYTFVDENDDPITFKGITTVHHSYKRDGHATATIWYSLNDVAYEYMAIDSLTAGKHIITVEYPITGLDTNVQYTWKIMMKAGSGSIAVGQNTLRATIFGQGLSDANVWDGNIDISDEVTKFDIPAVAFADLEEGEVVVSLQTPILSDTVFTDEIDTPDIESPEFVDLEEGTLSVVLQNIVYNLVSEDGLYNIVSADGQYNITTEA